MNSKETRVVRLLASRAGANQIEAAAQQAVQADVLAFRGCAAPGKAAA